MLKKWSKNGYRLEMYGDKKVALRLGALRKMYEKKFNKALEEEGKLILKSSKPRVPYDTGSLQKSGRVQSGKEGTNYVVAVGYGNETYNKVSKATTDKYARYQHETNPNKNKYLEKTFSELEGGMTQRIKMKLKDLK